jgi:1,4-alpha-glucan branching enzyme
LKILILTWEFPPRIVGELGIFVNKLVNALKTRKVDVYVVTFQDDSDGSIQELNGIKLCRVSNPVKTHLNILTWDLTLMTEFERVSSNIYYATCKKIDVIDAQEWICIPAAIMLKKAFDLPIIFTIHSLEEHRSNFANEPLNISIKNIEHLGIIEADKILVKSKWMKSEISKLHGGFEEKVEVISPRASTWIKKVSRVYKRISGDP